VDQPSTTTPEAAPPPVAHATQPAGTVGHPGPPGFRTRGRVRRRVRFLRKARELAYRDLGGLVFNLHRFAQRNDALVIAKLGTLTHIDAELRSLETTLKEHQPVTVLREAGVTACPRCAAIHSGEDRFCPNCGLSMSRRVDLPIAGASGAVAAPPSTGPAAPAPAPGDGAASPATSTPGPLPASAPASTPAPDAPAGRPASKPRVSTPAAPTAPAAPPAPAARPAPTTKPAPTATPAPAQAPAQATPGDETPTEILRPPKAGA
jgi:hypothetical protein